MVEAFPNAPLVEVSLDNILHRRHRSTMHVSFYVYIHIVLVLILYSSTNRRPVTPLLPAQIVIIPEELRSQPI